MHLFRPERVLRRSKDQVNLATFATFPPQLHCSGTPPNLDGCRKRNCSLSIRARSIVMLVCAAGLLIGCSQSNRQIPEVATLFGMPESSWSGKAELPEGNSTGGGGVVAKGSEFVYKMKFSEAVKLAKAKMPGMGYQHVTKQLVPGWVRFERGQSIVVLISGNRLASDSRRNDDRYFSLVLCGPEF